MNKAPIIGFVRYSQKIVFGNQKNARNVFESGYFEYRFNIFKNVTLKSFQNQNNQNFVLLLLHSVNMPEIYKKWFYELEKTNSFLYNLFIDDNQEDFDKVLSESIKYISFENDTAITFRIDNDDAVQSNFIEKLSNFLKPDFVGFCINTPLMYRVKRISDYSFMLEEFYFPANAIGLAHVTGRENYKTVFELGDHDLVNNQYAIVLFPKLTGGGLMTINGENEVNSINRTKSVIIKKEDLNYYLSKRKIENLDLNCLKILKEENNSIRFSFMKLMNLMIPPVFFMIIHKLRGFFK